MPPWGRPASTGPGRPPRPASTKPAADDAASADEAADDAAVPPPPTRCRLPSPWLSIRLAALAHGATDLSLALIDDALSRRLGSRRYLGASTSAVFVVGCVQVLCAAVFTPATRLRICRACGRCADAVVSAWAEDCQCRAALVRNGFWPPFGRLITTSRHPPTETAAAPSSRRS